MPYCPVCKDEFVTGVATCDTCAVPLVEALPPDAPSQSVTEVVVATYSGEAEAQLWASILWEEGIPSVLVPLGPGAGAWGSSAFLPHELRVRSQDAERAKELLSEAE